MLKRIELENETQSLSWRGLFILIMLIIANIRETLGQSDHDDLDMSNAILMGSNSIKMMMDHFDRVYRVSLIDESRPSEAVQVTLTHDELNFIREALLSSCNEEGLLRLVPDDNFNIIIAPEKHLQALFQTSAPIYGANSAELKGIFINEFVLDNLDDASRKKQLVDILNNELSTVLSRQTKQMKLEKNNQSASGFFKTAPWISDKEFKKIDKAFKQYQTRIEDYRNLSEKSKLTTEKQKQLQHYNRAIETYDLLLFGKHKNTVFDIPSKKVKTLKKTNRDCFFADYDHRDYLLSSEIYSQNKHTNLAERISDFDMLSEKMKRTFGKELCEELDQLHELSPNMYCSRTM